MHPAWIEIDLVQFKKNIAIVKSAVGDVRLCLPIKANAYGHGLIEIAHAAVAAGVDYLAVAHVQEAVHLRNASITTPIIVLGAIHEDQIDYLLKHDLEFTLSSAYKARFVARWCEQFKRVAHVHLEVDTGMRRTGMRADTARQLYAELQGNSWFHVKGIYSHLATGISSHDETALAQIEEFTTMLAGAPFKNAPLIRHLANSSATQHLPSSFFDMVRPALLCFGYKAPNAAAFSTLR